MDDPRYEPGMPVLDRQAVREPKFASTLPPSLQGLPPRSVPELQPTPLQRHYISLSVVGLVCGTVAISALELGAPLGSPLVKLCVLVGAPLLVLTTADAALRIWRSALAWRSVNPGRAAFRLAWFALTVLLLAILIGVTWLVLSA